MTKGRGLSATNGQKKRPAPKRLFNMVAEEEFFEELDKLCDAEKPPISRAHMLRKLVFERATPNKSLNGHAPKLAAKVAST
jgi:hypothetical protein